MSNFVSTPPLVFYGFLSFLLFSLSFMYMQKDNHHVGPLIKLLRLSTDLVPSFVL